MIGAIKCGFFEEVIAWLTADERERALSMLQVIISSSHRTAVWMPPFNNQ